MIIQLNEIFAAPQGEGFTQGQDAVFVRVAGCDLACGFCDTPYTWNWANKTFMHPDKFDPAQEIHPQELQDLLAKVEVLAGTTINRVVITGGEPLLQQRRLVFLTSLLRAQAFVIEVETNATTKPSEEFCATVDQWNVSPKLTNSGPDNPRRKRIVPEVLDFYAKQANAYFKFVVAQWVDAKEAADLIAEYCIQKERVWFMPMAKTQTEHAELEPQVREMARAHMVNYTSRQQIQLHGNKRGV